MDTAIITDSTCDLGLAAEVAYQIDIVPLMVTMDKKVFRDGVDIGSAEFYNRLSKASTLPTTSQPAPALFEALFRRRLDEGKDIFGLFLSADLSGTYQSAMIARSRFSDEEQKRIVLADSRHATGNLGLLVLEAIKLRNTGLRVEEIRDHIVSLIPRVKLYAALDTLKFLRMGGRLSAAAAVAGSILNIVPIVTVINGKVAVAAKIRKGQNAFRKWLREKLNNDLPDQRYPAIYLHAGNPALVSPIQEEFRYLLSPGESFCLTIGSVVGTHAGPGAAGLSYVSRPIPS